MIVARYFFFVYKGVAVLYYFKSNDFQPLIVLINNSLKYYIILCILFISFILHNINIIIICYVYLFLLNKIWGCKAMYIYYLVSYWYIILDQYKKVNIGKSSKMGWVRLGCNVKIILFNYNIDYTYMHTYFILTRFM